MAGTWYFISPDGDDERGDGSRERPWRTIGKACTIATEADTVVIPPGRYPPFTPVARVAAQYPPAKEGE